MRFAFSAPTAGPPERNALFAAYRSAAYDGLQLKKAQFIAYLDDPRQFLHEWGDHAGIASGLIVGGDLDENGRADLRRHLSFAGAVGAARVIFCHARPRPSVSQTDLRAFARVLDELGKEARQLDTRLSLHHHYNQPVMHRDDFDTFFDAVPDTSVGLTVDTAHLVKSGIDDIPEVIGSFSTYIDNFHLKDFAAGEFRVLGQGDIDFPPVFEAMHATGYDGWLCADEESGGDIGVTLSQCYQFMRSGAEDASAAGTGDEAAATHGQRRS